MESVQGSTTSSGSTVLLAVSDDVTAELLAHRMSRRGLDPVRAELGSEVRAQLRSHEYDLVVVESRLPGLTGLELLRLVGTEDVKGTPEIVILGQKGDDEEVVRAFDLGAAEYIPRPFAPQVALSRILRFLRSQPSQGSRPHPAAGLALLPGPPQGLESLLPEFSFFGGTIVAIAGLLCLAIVFALVAVARHIQNKQRERRQNRLAARWKPHLFSILAGQTAPEALTERIDSTQDRAFVEFLVPYAIRLDGAALATIRSLADPFLTRLEADLEARRAGTRARAVQLFGLLGDTSCRGILRRRLDDPSPLVTYTAFRWLCRRGSSEAVEPLLRRLDILEGMDVNQLSSLLLKLGSDAAPTLRSHLADPDQSVFVRMVCAETLRWMGDGESAALASQLLAYEPPPELTAALLRLLRRVGCPEHALLARSYCNSAVPFVRIHAARALGQIGHPDEDRRILGELVSDAESRWVALNAAKSLTELGQDGPLQELSETRHPRASLAQRVLEEPPI